MMNPGPVCVSTRKGRSGTKMCRPLQEEEVKHWQKWHWLSPQNLNKLHLSTPFIYHPSANPPRRTIMLGALRPTAARAVVRANSYFSTLHTADPFMSGSGFKQAKVRNQTPRIPTHQAPAARAMSSTAVSCPPHPLRQNTNSNPTHPIHHMTPQRGILRLPRNLIPPE